MRLIAIDDLEGNEILAVPVLSANDHVLIQSDTVLRQEYIDKLRSHDVYAVYIKDEVVYDVEDTLEASREVVKRILDRHIYKHSAELKRIVEQADKIIDSVISKPEVLNSLQKYEA